MSIMIVKHAERLEKMNKPSLRDNLIRVISVIIVLTDIVSSPTYMPQFGSGDNENIQEDDNLWSCSVFWKRKVMSMSSS